MAMANSTGQRKRTETPKISSAEAKRQVSAAFVNCAVLRGAPPSKDALKLYTDRLVQEPIEDVLLALEKLAEQPKKEFESAVPEIGAILGLVHTCTLARQNRDTATKSQRLVRWKCEECGTTACGFPSTSDALERRCNGIPKDNRTDVNAQGKRVCGARMVVVHDDEREKSDSGPLEQWAMPEWMQR
jgi:hypothetical protein